MNKVILCGNIGQDVEVKYIKSETALAKFSIATKETIQRKDGTTESQSTWHNVTCWGKLAEKCASLRKGNRAYVEGQLKTDSYEKDGKKIYQTFVNASHVEFGINESRPIKQNILDEAKAVFNAEYTVEDVPF